MFQVLMRIISSAYITARLAFHLCEVWGGRGGRVILPILCRFSFTYLSKYFIACVLPDGV